MHNNVNDLILLLGFKFGTFISWKKQYLGKTQKVFLPVKFLRIIKGFTRSTCHLLCWKKGGPLLPALPREQGGVLTARTQHFSR